tara:strand:+ start:5531 stop:6694 length:1164 start_codon:yes stop_codon:yes gene_type:complete
VYFSKNIKFEGFKSKTKKKKIILRYFNSLLRENSQTLISLKPNYKNNYSKNLINKFKKFKNIRIIGMGGSVLGTQAIFEFLKKKIKKKKIYFFNNLTQKIVVDKKKKYLNIITSKSGNTLETFVNCNILISKNDANLFITENKKSLISKLAEELKSQIVHHNNFIGGRYSVLSEVGMLPSELVGLKVEDFKQFNYLIKKKNFINSLISNVENIAHLIEKKKFNSIVLNYDANSDSFFKWYQQLVAESLGKKGRGILPVISTMPKDNHSLMQLYLDGPQRNFFTLFNVYDKDSNKLSDKKFSFKESKLSGKNINHVLFAQKKATEEVFRKMKIPFRSFEIYKRNEKTLGELFCFFILETILLGKILSVNPFDQPAVELIKKQTKKNLT